MADDVRSPMYAYLLGMYLRGVLTEAALDAAVVKGRITTEEAAMIRAAKADQDAEILEAADAAVVEDLTQ